MSTKKQLSRFNYGLIFLAFFVAAAIAVATLWKADVGLIALLGISASALLMLTQVVEQKRTNIDDAESELDSQKMEEIREKVVVKTSELENKQKVISHFLRTGIVKEQDLIHALNQQAFIIFYHFNRALDEEIAKFMPDNKKFAKSVLEKLGFVPVGPFYGSYFFHVISSKALPEPLDNVTYLEAYVKKCLLEYWTKLENNLKESGNEKLYNEYKKNKRLKGNLSYFLGKVFPSNLSIGYLNFSSFDKSFLEYCARFTPSDELDIDVQQFRSLISMASIDFFIDSIEPKDRRIISRNETAIKKYLQIQSIFDYEAVHENSWTTVLTTYFDIGKAQMCGKVICYKAKQLCPILREFV